VRVVVLCDDLASSVKEPLAHSDEDLGEERLLVSEVAVDGRSAHPDCRAELLEAHSGESALGEEARGCLDERRMAIGFRPLAIGHTHCHFS